MAYQADIAKMAGVILRYKQVVTRLIPQIRHLCAPKGLLVVVALCLPVSAGCSDDGPTTVPDASVDSSIDASRDAQPDRMDSMVDAPIDGPCPDADGDGVSSCDGDCDDANPLVYPSAVEVCGDGVTNNCGGDVADSGCMGMGTFVAPPPMGDDANDGTAASPVATISEGLAHALAIGFETWVVVAEGDYAEAVSLVNDVTIRGGYNPGTWTRDVSMRVSRIAAADEPGAGGFSATVRADAVTAGLDGMAVATPAMGLANRAAIQVSGASQVRLQDVVARCTAGDFCSGVLVNDGSLEIDRVRVELNQGTERTGVLLRNSMNAQLIDLQVNNSDGGDRVSGVWVDGGRAVIYAPTILIDRVNERSYGVAITGAATATLYNGVLIMGGIMSATGFSSAVSLRYPDDPSGRPDVLIHSNLLVGGSGGTRSSGLAFEYGGATILIAGRIYNNHFRSGTGDNRFGVYESNADVDPEVFENNAMYVQSGGADSSAAYHNEGRFDLDRASDINDLGGHADNIVEDCAPVDLAGGDYHLPEMSPCIDAGGRSELPPTDFEDGPRGLGLAPDIGPDEAF